MKRRIFILALICILLTAAFAPNSSAAPAKAEKEAVEISAEQVKAARFLNMLNHNYNYNDDIASVDTIVNNSVLALLDQRDENNEDFVPADLVCDYVMNMYGIEIVDLTALNAEYPQADGFVYIIPRGFTSYSHEYISSTVNEDGSTTVYTSVTLDYHDGESETFDCVSLFVPNEASAFGYSIIRSDIQYDAQAV